MSNPGPNQTVTSNIVQVQGLSVDGQQMGLLPNSLIGFWGKTPAAQVTPTGLTATAAAGSTTSVFVNTTFNGGSGTAFTVGDVVFALKAAGLLKA